MKPKLKICILLDEFDVPKWIHDCIKSIIDSNHSEIVLYVKNKPDDIKKLTFFSRITRCIKEWKYFFYYRYLKIDTIFFKKFTSQFQTKTLTPIVNSDVLSVKPIETKFSDRFDQVSISKIKKYDIDIILRFGFRILRGDILTKCSKYGVWSFHHADYKFNRGGPAGLWEFLKNNPYTGITLQILNEELDNGRILYQTYSTTNTLSLNGNRDNCYKNSCKILERVISQLYYKGADEFYEEINQREPTKLFYDRPLYKTPSNITIIAKLSKKILIGLKNKIRNKFHFNQWSLSYCINKNNDSYCSSFYKYKTILPPRDRFWADPFVIKKNSIYFIFFEEVLLVEDKGRICYIEIDSQGNISESRIALETNFHLSYPFIIEDKNELYMIPETMENNRIELYKCIKFPNKWELDHVMIKNLQAVDSTIFKHNGKYWMFSNLRSDPNFSINEELYLFFSESLHGEWTSHPLNPIISDIRKSRPAGNIIEANGRIYRPSQDSSIRYGYSININEIIKISECEYEERPVEHILPKWSNEICGVHTINRHRDMTVIDCLKRRRKFF